MTSKLPTPSMSHLDFSTIYEPAEDSFLFLDTLSSESETDFLQWHFRPSTSRSTAISDWSPPPLLIEIGTGSGVILSFVTAHAKKIFGRSDVLTLGADVNDNACRGTVETVTRAVKESQSTNVASDSAGTRDGEASGKDSGMAFHESVITKPTGPGCALYLGNISSDLVTAIRRHSVDVLIFNPPYVPTETLPDHTGTKHQDRFNEESHLLALSYAGGLDGMEVTERLLNQLPGALSWRGVAYVLFCARNKPQEALKRIMRGPEWEAEPSFEWETKIVGKTGGKGGWERLEIVRIRRKYTREEVLEP